MNQLTAYQIAEWEAYDKIDPIGTWRDDYRLAYLCSLVTNLTISVHGKKGSKHTVPIDFMLDYDVEKEKPIKKQTPEEMLEILTGLASVHNKKERLLSNTTPPKRNALGKTKGL